jgi:hypothetical protein
MEGKLMIPKRMKADEIVGRMATLDSDICNGAGLAIAKGSKVKIVRASYGIEIKTEICSHCGQYAYISKLKRDDLTLIDNDTVQDHCES